MKQTLLTAVALFVLSGNSFAVSPQSSDVSVYYVNQDLDLGGDSIDGDGFGLAGTLILPTSDSGGLYIPLEYNDTELDIGSGIDLELEDIRAGLGYVGAINPSVSLYGGARYLRMELKIDDFGSGTLDGLGLFGGARFMLGPAVKAYGELSYVDAENDGGGSLKGGEGTVGIAADFDGPGLFAEYRYLQLEDDFELSSFHVGARYSF